MHKDKIKDSWQYSELRRYLTEHSQDSELDSRTVFLANPQQKAKLDNVILKHLWPSVIKGLRSSEIWVKSLKEGFPKSAIKDENYPYTARALTLLLEDPRRQVSIGDNTPWYCRLKIHCSVFDYMVSSDFYVYFPEGFSLKKIRRLLKNPEFAGYPPELSYERSLTEKGIFSLAFRKGSGAGWGLHSYDEAKNRIGEEIKSNIEVIKAVYDLEKNYKSTKAFNQLERILVRVFASG